MSNFALLTSINLEVKLTLLLSGVRTSYVSKMVEKQSKADQNFSGIHYVGECLNGKTGVKQKGMIFGLVLMEIGN
jgi:hypothetical protein